MAKVGSISWRLARAFTRSLPIKQVRSHATAPMASITFDDFPRSAWTAGGPILARYGAKATYYAAGRFCGKSEEGIAYYEAADLADARRAGHEIGAHSFGHDIAPQVTTRALIADAERNAAFLAEHLAGERAASYAYPYGEASPRTKALMAERFATARGIAKGVNAGTIDLAELKAIPLEARRWRPDEIDAAIARAKASTGWIVFFTHDVSDEPSPFGATPQMLEWVLERLAAEAIEILPVKHAAARVTFGD
jgi:peptidoglycan/xylan/chitin deacetylase (PgdA/CDA1 family)